jgi:hypothetical protein
MEFAMQYTLCIYSFGVTCSKTKEIENFDFELKEQIKENVKCVTELW